ncbi:BON domain-containing protein [Micromonospora sp. WMMD718]|uniref:BON domain-containing protein n=1 Tax=unclassified Micromonospora TaxID=2617518 RepID=UPI00064C2D30|nr:MULTISPECIES: BON domain-containing protein [unclassified Micromonospora]MDG4752654.1 BON domain-containing protein [Micromonospora sp. WMMD718]
MTYPWFYPERLPSPLHGDPVADDTRLACHVATLMGQDPLLRHERICVEAQNRVVILEGRVSSTDARARARALAWAVPAALDVSVRLHVV